MTQNIGGLSADILSCTFNYASSPAVGGTDVTADTAGITHGWLYVGDFNELDVDVICSFTGGASPTVTINVDRAMAGGPASGLVQTFASNAATGTCTAGGSTVTFSIGAGLSQAKGFGRYARVTWTAIVGAPTAMNLIVSVIGKAA